jgi:hypothetical protein
LFKKFYEDSINIKSQFLTIKYSLTRKREEGRRGVAELGYEIIGAIPPWLPQNPPFRAAGGVSTGANPRVQVNHTFIEQRLIWYIIKI